MGKVVTTILVVAVAVAVVVFAPQIAAAIGASGIFGATVTAATIAAITSGLVGFGVSVALTAAYTLFRKVPNMSQSLVDRLNSSVVPSAPRKIVFGRTAAGADVRFFETYDLPATKKDGYAQIIALASHRINSVQSWYLEDEMAWNGFAVVGAKTKGILGVRACLEGSAANAFAWGSGALWTTAHRFTGCAYLAVKYKLDTDVWDSGIPSRYTTIVEGCPLYDPRLDSTNGGAGSHRIGDQSTWQYRAGSVDIGRNPALALLTYLLGYRINGKLAWGMGIPASRIDFDNFRLYANICEESVLTADGGHVQRYTADGSFSTADSHETVIAGLTAAMGSCKLIDAGGVYQIIGGYDDTLGPVIDFDENDLISAPGSAAPFTWKPAPPLRETYNIARGRFANPDDLYQLVDWGVVETDALPDAIPRTMSLDLGLVSRAETCQRIAKQFLLREALAPGVFSATFGPKAFAVQVGSLMSLTLAERGWNRKLFRVVEQVENHDLIFSMVLREESAAIYEWDREEKPLPAGIRPTGYNSQDTISPAGLTVTSELVEAVNDVQISQVTVNWTAEPSDRVTSIQIESRPITLTAWTEQAAAHDPEAGVFIFSSNLPGSELAVRARFRMSNGIFGPWVASTIQTVPIVNVDGEARTTAVDAKDIAEAAKDTADDAKAAAAQAAADVAAAQNQIAELFDAAGDINTAVGTATTAANNAEAAKTLAQNAANQSQQNVLRAASHATGNIIAKGSFSDGSAGEWFGNASVVTPTVAPPSGAAKVLRATNRDNLEGSFREANWTGRIVNVDFTARALGAYQAGLGVHIVHADGSLNFIGYGWAQPGAGWQHITGDIQLPSSPPIAKLIPWLHVDGPWHDPQNIAEFDALTIEDVTEQRRAAQSASASLTSANTAAAKANDAAAQAAAAESAKLSAQTSAGQASAYRDQSATSASTADSAKNTATSQANLAASLRDQTAGYANSASTSAGLASASKDAAGVSASSASGSANTASIQASNALASANSANNSAVVATSQAAAAQQSSVVAASIALGTFNPNPTFSAYSNTSGVPDNWNDWSNGQGQSWRVTGESGLGYAMAQNNAAGQNVGLYANFVTSIKANDYVVIEGRVRLETGSLWGAGVLLQFFDPSQNYLGAESISFVFDVDATGNVGGAGTAGKTYAFSKLVRAPNANVALARLFQMTAWDGFDGGRPAKTLSWYRAAVRPATSAEIAAKQALDQVGSLSATVTTQAGAIASLQGKTSAYWQVEAVAGGRAQLRVYADSNGGGGVDIVGDLRVTGNAIITGTVNPEALALDRFVKRINGTGAGSPAAGQTLLLYAQDIGVTTANGSYLIVLTGQMTTTVGRQTSTLGGLPYYINHNADGGLRIVINKNGSTIYQTDIHASEYITANDVGPKVYSLNRNIEIDSPGGGDASGGNATILIYAVRGGADSGAVNQGDYYTRDVSATYSGFNIAAKTKWTFV